MQAAPGAARGSRGPSRGAAVPGRREQLRAPSAGRGAGGRCGKGRSPEPARPRQLRGRPWRRRGGSEPQAPLTPRSTTGLRRILHRARARAAFPRLGSGRHSPSGASRRAAFRTAGPEVTWSSAGSHIGLGRKSGSWGSAGSHIELGRKSGYMGPRRKSRWAQPEVGPLAGSAGSHVSLSRKSGRSGLGPPVGSPDAESRCLLAWGLQRREACPPVPRNLRLPERGRRLHRRCPRRPRGDLCLARSSPQDRKCPLLGAVTADADRWSPPCVRPPRAAASSRPEAAAAGPRGDRLRSGRRRLRAGHVAGRPWSALTTVLGAGGGGARTRRRGPRSDAGRRATPHRPSSPAAYGAPAAARGARAGASRPVRGGAGPAVPRRPGDSPCGATCSRPGRTPGCRAGRPPPPALCSRRPRAASPDHSPLPGGVCPPVQTPPALAPPQCGSQAQAAPRAPGAEAEGVAAHAAAPKPSAGSRGTGRVLRASAARPGGSAHTGAPRGGWPPVRGTAQLLGRRREETELPRAGSRPWSGGGSSPGVWPQRASRAACSVGPGHPSADPSGA